MDHLLADVAEQGENDEGTCFKYAYDSCGAQLSLRAAVGGEADNDLD